MIGSDPFVQAQSSVRANFTTRKYNNESEQSRKNEVQKGREQWRNGGDEEETRERADEMTTAGKNQNQMYSHLCLGMIGKKEKRKSTRKEKEEACLV